MVIDTSVIVAMMLHEPDAPMLLAKMAEAKTRSTSACSYMEASMVVIARRGDETGDDIDRALYEANIAIIPLSVQQAKIAREAFIRFGKGRHPAALNFGDCFAYALARQTNSSLLFKGNDFSKTDIRIA
jgi:ribonuclease VapC